MDRSVKAVRLSVYLTTARQASPGLYYSCTTCYLNSQTSESGTASSPILDTIAAFRKENNYRLESNNIKFGEVQAEVKSVLQVQVISSLKAEFLEVKAQCREAGENVDIHDTNGEEVPPSYRVPQCRAPEAVSGPFITEAVAATMTELAVRVLLT
ncbi:hypothetical protein J6590_048978 [Homalodisca vitripennis]|nr:hypothetical protein J6590_048978 [Homalodisca vitripennis]